jgi:hypothetical protein
MHNAKPTYESFEATIIALKRNANAAGTELTNGEIAGKIDIPLTLFEKYYKEDRAPSGIFDQLRKNFSDFLPYLYRRVKDVEEIRLPDHDLEE